ncbi:MAG: phosphoribosylamine--glycine ligase [Aquisalimonadaceae bacterium]
MNKRFLIVGSEAREHAMAWKLARSAQVEHVYVAPGNPAMLREPGVSVVDIPSYEELAEFACREKIDCTVISAAAPMVRGAVDAFRQRGLTVLGAPKVTAELEASKYFSKLFMLRHGVPTPLQRSFKNPLEALGYLRNCEYPVVLKSDERTSSYQSAIVLDRFLDARWACSVLLTSARNGKVLVEDCIKGREISYTILMDGTNWVAMCPFRNYKQIGNADRGGNTGGMGGYAPVPWVTPDLEQRIVSRIVLPTLRGMQQEHLQYRGFLSFDIIVDDTDAPWLLDFNTSIGDPEAQTTLMLLEDDFADLLVRAAIGELGRAPLCWRDGWAMTASLAPNGYPKTTVVGQSLALPAQSSDQNLRYFGGRLTGQGNRFLTRDERCASVTTFSPDARCCRERMYQAAGRVDGGLLVWRTDIGSELDFFAEQPASLRGIRYH